VAPKVAGIITKVWVHNDQFVEKDTPLFQIDRQSYEIALLAAKDVYMASFVRLSLFFFVTLYAWWTVALLDAWRHRRLRRKHRLTEEPA
ncbi:biotin/lipoyl-binding protein, partial [Thiolapillus sp.]|uniref:biotin/lipoyl-binding protein n=1 Tax=Thiolapillus sp. TaxID=2017437 RepID=UPI003AF5D67D